MVLASRSPRRMELLSCAGYSVCPVDPCHDEPEFETSGLSPIAYAESVALDKARSAVRRGARGVVLGADTIVVYGGRVFGKAADATEARRILGTLAGTTHEVITGVALVETGRKEERVGHEVTRVTMREMSGEALSRYIESGLWRGKAGAYGIQDRSDAYVERCEGSFSNVMGLPLEKLAGMLAEMGVRVPETNSSDNDEGRG